MKMAESAWVCGDPGMQYDTLINRWNPCKATHRINASNPCSEYMFIDDSACNLASLNLMKFAQEDGGFDVERFRHAVDVVFAAQEMLVSEASYPTPAIEKNSHDFRPIGLGYANLGALLMYNGLPYDSDEGRRYAAAVTSLMHGQAYLTSSKIAVGDGHVRRLRAEPRRVPRGHLHAPRRGVRRREAGRPEGPLGSAARRVGPHARVGPPARLPQRAGHRPRAHRAPSAS